MNRDAIMTSYESNHTMNLISAIPSKLSLTCRLYVYMNGNLTMPFVNIKIQVRGMLKHRLAQFYAELQLNDECLQALHLPLSDSCDIVQPVVEPSFMSDRSLKSRSTGATRCTQPFS